MARRRFGIPQHFAQAMTFDELPVGACYAFAPGARRATAKKTGARQALTWPGGVPTPVKASLPVRLMPCRLDGLGQMRPPERYIVTGPARFRRLYTNFEDAVNVATRCSKRSPTATCRIAQGWPGSERPIIECARARCRRTGLRGLAWGRKRRKGGR
jgi:hypothetical protein